ncbi:MAG TPA: GGDEF domain-containing protein [Candidatus Saccharimonadales bacterium]|nr:GGDEF domain-containing protein [Candidatus Saccharimonadales bacterium]
MTPGGESPTPHEEPTEAPSGSSETSYEYEVADAANNILDERRSTPNIHVPEGRAQYRRDTEIAIRGAEIEQLKKEGPTDVAVERAVADATYPPAKVDRRYAREDALTGLQNRHAFGTEIGDGDASHPGKAIVAIDADNFKPVNDELGGHAAGDAVLQLLAEILNDGVHPTFRMGGDEFAIQVDEAEAEAIAERIRRDLAEALSSEEPIPLPTDAAVSALKPTDVRDAGFGVTIGIGPTWNTADQAMMEAKAARSEDQIRRREGDRRQDDRRSGERRNELPPQP